MNASVLQASREIVATKHVLKIRLEFNVQAIAGVRMELHVQHLTDLVFA